ncbi:peroxiredoxin [Urechidicola croceus]|uniref:thioredoxin-dependent peroxiredoxin n=1 Tax=Urechidicola croceus TaxID=1850246 RepID=A0A1D8P5S0_9FLAO|nr:peroxiredoxin [Urechidicola croceus]AOW19925.1 peroxiredoxin [Urechidicola croceus]
MSQKIIRVGDEIPLFALTDQNGKEFLIKNLIGRKKIVLFFYPKDFTPGCVREACSFRDQYDDFKNLGAEVIGISSDSLKSHQKFAEKYKLPYTLLSDTKGRVRKQFGVPKSVYGLLPGRMTYVIDEKGIVQLSFKNQFGTEKHIEQSLNLLKTQHNEIKLPN